MEGHIGKLALVGDVWYQIMDKRSDFKENSYLLYSKDYWIPESWIKEVRSNEDFINAQSK